MRILMISDVYFPRINGVSTSIQIFRQELIRLGHQVTLIAPDYGEQAEEKDIIRIPARKVLFDPEDRFMQSRAIKALVPKLKADNYDIIHIQTPFVAHYLGTYLARRLNLPCIETYHTFFEEYLYHYVPFIPRPWMRAIARLFTRKQCNAVDAVVVPSTAMQAVLKNYGVTQIMQIIPTGLELENFKDCDGQQFRQQHGVDAKRPVLVHIGRVAYEKNIHFILNMLSQLKKSVPNVLLIIAGEGPALASLKKQVKQQSLTDNVLFVGYLSRADALLNCYCAGDVFVFSSRTETQGLVLLEAMALGVPVVSTAVMGTIDILTPRRGALVSPEEPQIFADNVKRIIENPFLRERLSKEAKQYVQNWTAPTMAQQMAAFYDSLVPSNTASEIEPVSRSLNSR